MDLKQRSAADVSRQMVAELGLDPGQFDIASAEAIAGALRRAAVFLCRCPGRSLVRAVVTPLRGLVDDVEEVSARVEATLEAMVSHGDLHEFRELDAGGGGKERAVLSAAPAAFVFRETGALFLVGIFGDQLSALPEDLANRIEHVGHTRHLNPKAGENLRETLKQHGLLEIQFDDWVREPQSGNPGALISRYDHMLDSGRPSGDVPGLRLLDPERPVGYYRGRWVSPSRRSGRFVARRDQAYGAPLWCYVRVSDGEPQALVDLPLAKSRWRGCDEAWHLQMAIDANRGNPQRFAIRVGPDDTHILAFFSPVPMWSKRRWDAIGVHTPSERCLFAYRIAKDELPQELRFIRRALWLEQISDGER